MEKTMTAEEKTEATFEVRVAEDEKKIEIVLPSGETESTTNLFKNPIVLVIMRSRITDAEKTFSLWSDVLAYRLPKTYAYLAREADPQAFTDITAALFEVSQKKLEEEKAAGKI